MDVSQLGSILGVWAHPDDETFMVGGLLSMAVVAGQRVTCITATKGEAGVQNESKWPLGTLAQIRAAELEAALTSLGITTHQWLDYADGQCKNVPRTEAIDRIKMLIDQYKPDTIITFAPDGLTGHDDHKAVSEWTTAAAQQSTHKAQLYYAVHTEEQFTSAFKDMHNRFNIYFNIKAPVLMHETDCDLVVELMPRVMEKKLHALQSMPSQYESFFEACSQDELQRAFKVEALIKAK